MVNLSTKILGASIAAAAIFIILGVFGQYQTGSVLDSPRAAIIDSLYDDIPNSYFHSKAREYLEAGGYQVDIYTTANSTVDLFKNLPSMNYGFIVIRSHALAAKTENNDVMIFTGEKYTEKKYIAEQLFGQIKKGSPLLEQTFSIDPEASSGWMPVNGSNSTRMMTGRVVIHQEQNQEYFLITPKMIDDLMVGRFQNSTVFLGGCNTLENPSLAESFIKRGASNVIGWTNLVSSSDNDRTMLRTLESMMVDKLDLQKSVEKSNESRKSGHKYNATLQIYK